MARYSNQNILDIVQGLQQASENGKDYQKFDKDENNKVGLKREVDNPILQTRQMDGFSVTFAYDTLRVNYQAEISLKSVHERRFENDLEKTITEIVSYLKKEYQKITGKAVQLTPIDDSFKARVESTGKVRTWVTASKLFKIGNLKVDSMKDEYQENYEKKFKKWIKMQEKEGKKPDNVEIDAKDNEKEEID